VNLGRYWRGEEPLSRSFWVAYIGGSFAVLLLTWLIAVITGLALGISIYSLSLLVVIAIGLFNPYYTIGWVSVWRSAARSQQNLGASLAKLVVVAHMAIYAYFLTLIPESMTELMKGI
jgi:hypothetical protein